MDEGKINLFVSTMSDKFNGHHLLAIRSELERLPDSKFPYLQVLPFKNPVILLIVSIFVGALGIDRFLVGDVTLGVLKLITCGGLGIWTIVDWFLIMERVKEKNFELFMLNAK